MKFKELFIAITVLIIVVLGFFSTRNSPQTTVIIVRHAEKSDTPPEDVSLNSEGRLRAESLVDVAEEAGVTLVYVTQYARTKQTAEPLAAKLDIKIRVFEVNKSGPLQYAKDLAQKIKSEHIGETILIVSHSNTVPMIIEELGGGIIPPISDDANDDLFIISSHDWNNRVNLIKAKY